MKIVVELSHVRVSAFSGAGTFNEDLSKWDVARVTNLIYGEFNTC